MPFEPIFDLDGSEVPEILVMVVARQVGGPAVTPSVSDATTHFGVVSF
jgi:hypothetical protein